MFNRREQPLSKYVPWTNHVSDRCMLLSHGGVLAIFAIDGVAWETVDEATIAHLHDRLNLTWRSISRDDLILTVLTCRGEATADLYPTGTFRSAFARDLDATYSARLFDHSMYVNRCFLCVEMRPPRPVGEWMGEKVDRHRMGMARHDTPEMRVDALETICDALESALGRYSPTRLGLYRRSYGLFSEIAEAVVYALTGVWRPVPVTTDFIGKSMFSETIVFGHEYIEIRTSGLRQYAGVLGMKAYPSEFSPGMFNLLAATPYRHTTMHSFLCLSMQQGHDVLTRKQNWMVRAGDKAVEQLAELPVAASGLQAGRFVMGDHAFAMAVFADTVPALREVITAAWRDLGNAGVSAARETLGNQASYLSMIPGNYHLRLRPGAISSRAFAAFAPFHSFPSGKTRGYWGKPVAMFRTAGGTPYNFHLHVNDLGNVFITGRSGSGKTTWLGFIVAQAERLGAQVIIWDKDRGLELAVRAMGGTYLGLRNGVASVAPLRALDGNNPDDLAFLHRLLRGCITGTSDYEISQEDSRRLGLGIAAVMGMPPGQRELSDVCAFLSHADPNGARARLGMWCHGHGLGWVIDGRTHDVRLDSPIIGFDQTAILDNLDARGPIMATLYHLCEKLIDGRKLLFCVDEFWKSLQDVAFRDLVHDKLKTLRKRGAVVILATQSPRDALNTDIAHTIREQMATGVHFSNPQASMADYGEAGLGLTAQEVELVRTMEQGTGMFLLCQNGKSVTAQLRLEGMDKHIAILSGRESTVRLLDHIRDEVGDDPADWMPLFEQRRQRWQREDAT